MSFGMNDGLHDELHDELHASIGQFARLTSGGAFLRLHVEWRFTLRLQEHKAPMRWSCLGAAEELQKSCRGAAEEMPRRCRGAANELQKSHREPQ